MRHAGLLTVTVSELAALAPARAVSWRRVAIVAIVVVAIVTLALEPLDRRQVEQTWDTFRSLSVPLGSPRCWRTCSPSSRDHGVEGRASTRSRGASTSATG